MKKKVAKNKKEKRREKRKKRKEGWMEGRADKGNRT